MNPTNFHELKIKPEFYDLIEDEDKDFEIRKNDRDFQCDDIVLLKDVENSRTKLIRIKTVFQGLPGLQRGYCIFTFEKVSIQLA